MSQFNHIAAEMQAWLEGGELARKAYRAGVIAEAEERSRLRAHAPATPHTAQAWTLRKPVRFHGYTEPLFEALRAAHAAGEPCPTARAVLRLWAEKKPWDIAEVLAEEIKFYDAAGQLRFASIAAIGKAINRMTSKSLSA